MTKILTIDIETSPALVYTWGLYDQNIGLNQIVKPVSILSFAAKWLGSREVLFYADWTCGHEEMIRQAHTLISEADAIVGYNSTSFDLAKLQGEFLLLGLDPPPPPTSIDLLKSVKKLGLQSNKLAFVGPYLNLGGKVSHEGFDLWKKVMDGDKKAQAKMEKYNKGDVTLTEKLYLRIKPYIRSHPFIGDRGACGACDSNILHKRGYRRTKTMKIERLQCQKCGSWQDGKRTRVG